jgi:hypothetical protein
MKNKRYQLVSYVPERESVCEDAHRSVDDRTGQGAMPLQGRKG